MDELQKITEFWLGVPFLKKFAAIGEQKIRELELQKSLHSAAGCDTHGGSIPSRRHPTRKG